jgi:hypothetical protein
MKKLNTTRKDRDEVIALPMGHQYALRSRPLALDVNTLEDRLVAAERVISAALRVMDPSAWDQSEDPLKKEYVDAMDQYQAAYDEGQL